MLPLPLYQLRVLDLAKTAAGAYATRVLADFGAEVFKVEDAQYPDELRGDEPAFESLNRNKIGLSINTSTEAGRALCLRLAALCDFVFITDYDQRFDLDDILRASPNLMLVIIGSVGKADAETGMAAAGAALTALFHRRQTGKRQRIEVDERDVEANLDFLVAEEGWGAAEVWSQPLFAPEQLRERGLVEPVARQDGAIVEVDGVPYRFNRTSAHIRLPAPLPGEHNDYVLRHVLNLRDGEVASLRALGAVPAATTPA